jgi:RNA polymerase subunit RPABC4/transcription elongation factor Spt4
MLIKCPECKKEVSDKAQSCPNCGYPITEKPNSNEYIIDNVKYNIESVIKLKQNGRHVGAIKELARICNIEVGEAKKIFDRINISVVRSEPKCPRCGSTNIQWKNKLMAGHIFKRNVCTACGKHWR